MKLYTIILLGFLINTISIISSDKEPASLQNKITPNHEIIDIVDESFNNQITNTQPKINNPNSLSMKKTQNNDTQITYEQFCGTIKNKGEKFLYDKFINLVNTASNLASDKKMLTAQVKTKDDQIANLNNQQTTTAFNYNLLLQQMNNSQMIHNHNTSTLNNQFMILNQKLSDKTDECNTSWMNFELEKNSFEEKIKQRDDIINGFVETNTALKKEKGVLLEQIQALNDQLKKQKKSKKRKLHIVETPESNKKKKYV